MLSAERPQGVSRRSILSFVSIGFYVMLLGLAINARQGAPHYDRAPSGGWDREGAVRYLDERMEVWFANAKKLRTGQAETVCVSCHTTVPYVIARPALRRAMHVNTATPQEMRLLEETTRRVENFHSQRLLYDFNEKKKTESLGTEAVLNALILASGDAAHSRREPSAPTQKALEQLWDTQQIGRASCRERVYVLV